METRRTDRPTLSWGLANIFVRLCIRSHIEQRQGLKETAQKGQQLTWRRYDRSHELIRISPKCTYGRSQDHICRQSFIVRLFHGRGREVEPYGAYQGGASIYFWRPVVTVKCGDKKPAGCPPNRPLPKDIAANVFANVGSVEISEHRAPDFPRVRVRRCRGA